MIAWLTWLSPFVKILLSACLEAFGWRSPAAASNDPQPVDPVIAEVADERSKLANPDSRDALLRELRARAERERAAATL